MSDPNFVFLYKNSVLVLFLDYCLLTVVLMQVIFLIPSSMCSHVTWPDFGGGGRQPRALLRMVRMDSCLKPFDIWKDMRTTTLLDDIYPLLVLCSCLLDDDLTIFCFFTFSSVDSLENILLISLTFFGT